MIHLSKMVIFCVKQPEGFCQHHEFSRIPINPNNIQFQSGWWLTYPSEKYEFVKWDNEIPNICQYMESHKSHVPNHHPVILLPSGKLT